MHHLFGWVKAHGEGLDVIAVGHRVVHGGPVYAEPIIVDERALEVLTGFEPLAPAHQPHNLAPIRYLLKARPDLPQVACFDTAFHRTAPLVAELYALPRKFFDAGVRRYGFHGLSFEYIVQALAELDPVAARGRLVVAHLGNGCSMAAIRDGKSLGNTMGFTGLDGLPMGTRCGQIDPGVLIYLMQQRGLSLDQVEDLLYNHSGLKGLSGVSNDMRDLLESDQPDARTGHRLLRRPSRTRAGLAGRGARGPGRAGVHRRHRRALRRDPCAGLPRRDLAGRRAGRRGQPQGRPADLEGRVFPLSLGHPDQRRTDDRPAHSPAHLRLDQPPTSEAKSRLVMRRAASLEGSLR